MAIEDCFSVSLRSAFEFITKLSVEKSTVWLLAHGPCRHHFLLVRVAGCRRLAQKIKLLITLVAIDRLVAQLSKMIAVMFSSFFTKIAITCMRDSMCSFAFWFVPSSIGERAKRVDPKLWALQKENHYKDTSTLFIGQCLPAGIKHAPIRHHIQSFQPSSFSK